MMTWRVQKEVNVNIALKQLAASPLYTGFSSPSLVNFLKILTIYKVRSLLIYWQFALRAASKCDLKQYVYYINTIPYGPPWHSVATNNAESNFNGGPLRFPARIGRKGKTCIQVWVMRGYRHYADSACCVWCVRHGRRDWRALCLLLNELRLFVEFLWGRALFVVAVPSAVTTLARTRGPGTLKSCFNGLSQI